METIETLIDMLRLFIHVVQSWPILTHLHQLYLDEWSQKLRNCDKMNWLNTSGELIHVSDMQYTSAPKQSNSVFVLSHFILLN